MKTFLKKKTYKRQMFLFSLVTISIIILILGVYTGVNRSLIRQYNESYALYQYLNDFFDTQSFAHDSLKNYLYTKSEKEYDNFKRAFHQAKEDIQILNDSAQKNAGIWRFTLLDNMMDSYLEQANQVILLMKIQDHKYNEGYEKLLKINETIIQSSDDYYQLVTNVVDKILEKIEVTKQETDVFSWCIVAFSVIGLSIYTIIVLRSITNPIDKLVDNLHEIRAGTFDFHKIPASSEEIQVLCFALQDLSDTISRNIEYEKEKAELKNQLLIKENENLRKDELLVSSELKILQNQINPHFFFNTVNMIYQQAILEKADITVEMIEKMTECMRYTLSQNTRISNLAMELNFMRNYLYIQNRRFEGRIEFILEEERELPNIKIPAMIIEPLVDNAIKHGLSNTESGGLVVIHVECKDDQVIIHVSDNGKGMSAVALEQLIMNQYKCASQGENLGLYNLMRRLDMYYSKAAKITVNSYEDCGFDAVITIPVMKGW